jgi:hypothetical protein
VNVTSAEVNDAAWTEGELAFVDVAVVDVAATLDGGVGRVLEHDAATRMATRHVNRTY